jgi:hypothetical protein
MTAKSALPPLGGEQLGVGQALDNRTRSENHSRGDYRTGERAYTQLHQHPQLPSRPCPHSSRSKAKSARTRIRIIMV